MGSENKVNKIITLPQFVNDGLFLRHATAKSYFHLGIILFEGFKRTESSVNSLVRIIPDSAGIVYYKIGVIRFGLFKSYGLKYTKKLLGIPCIHLASEGGNLAGGLSVKALFDTGNYFLQFLYIFKLNTFFCV